MSNHGSMSISKVLFSPSSRFIRFATSRSISRLCFELTRVVFRTLVLSLPENPVLLKISILSHLPHRPLSELPLNIPSSLGFLRNFKKVKYTKMAADSPAKQQRNEKFIILGGFHRHAYCFSLFEFFL